MRASRVLPLSLAIWATLGAVWGLVDATAWSRRNHYWQNRFYWLLSDAFARSLLNGIALGLAAGLVIALFVWLAMRGRPDSEGRSLGALCLSLATASSLSFLVIRIVHDQVARHPNWRFWAWAIPLALAGLLVFLLLYRLLEPLEPLRRRNRSSFWTITAAGI